jgi:phytoene dehydrogenase-like protein
MGAITTAMRKAAEARGAVVSTDCPVARVLVEHGRAVGAALDNGEVIRARAVVSNVNPKLLLRDLVGLDTFEPELRARINGYACGSGTFRMNVALSELPDFSCLPSSAAAEHHRSGIVIGPSVDYLDRAYIDARAHGWSRAPIVEILLPSTMDDSLAPSGAHVASLFCQQFAPQLPDGRSWDDAREEAADAIIDAVTGYAPNFRRSIIARQIHSPQDLERKFGLVGGDIMHGRLSLDQMFSLRPQAGHGDFRMPVKGLYLCGAGAHPGGGVTGAPGHNAAKVILEDFRRRRIPE